MPGGVFYVLAYGAPVVLGLILGQSLFRRAASSSRRVLAGVWLTLWWAASQVLRHRAPDLLKTYHVPRQEI